MLTLKIRVPYKESTPQKFLELMEEQVAGIDIIGCEVEMVDNIIIIYIPNGTAPNQTLDLRLLEILEE